MDWFYFFTRGWGLGFTIYLLLQALAVSTVRGKFRLIVLLPAPFMIVVAALTAKAYWEGSNLWPILMIFASPVAAVSVAALWLPSLLIQRRGRSAAGST